MSENNDTPDLAGQEHGHGRPSKSMALLASQLSESIPPPTHLTQPSPIVEFYRGGCDSQGRSLADFLQWSDARLEYTHDYIQILFPIPEKSNFMLDPAPTLDNLTMEAFRNDHQLRAGMRKALARMLDFFGFSYEITSHKVETTLANDESDHQWLSGILPDRTRFPRAARNWMNSHNDLRITRIIRCLRCCGLSIEADGFYNALRAIYVNRAAYPSKIRDRTFMYWTRAAQRDLSIPPNLSDAEADELLATHNTSEQNTTIP
ncbi:hypothetical protein TWF694_011900 [Orbilia ellipsospora]|uniref:Opioid growth factor receptor (OGFr) conserved domain-containing protein n=1 Tax=Orbilia ellipsospora TaxID=2528407 RepID=A0AAV9X7U0_9PEZI